MGEKGNAITSTPGPASSSEGVVAAVVGGGTNVAGDLGDQAAKTVVALGAERAVEGLIAERQRSDEEEPDTAEPDGQAGGVPGPRTS